MSRDDIVQAIVIAIGCAATSFALVFLIKLRIKQEALFALVGALIGATATVGGAAWLSDHNRAVERDAEVSLLLTEYQKLLNAASAAQEAEPGTEMPWPKEYRPLLYKLADTAGNVHAIAGEALVHGKALSFIHRAAIRKVQFAIDEYLRFWTDANAEEELHPMDERTFTIVTAEVTYQCKVAIAELNGLVPFADEVQP